MANRPTIEVPTPPGGWGAPWPNVAELEAVLPHEKWTLVGGLMAQLHGLRSGMDVIRPTNDVVTGAPGAIDVLAAEHAAPRVIEKLRGHAMVAIEGGTQALKRTINARLSIVPERTTTISIPSPFAAVVLKAAAYRTDTRDRERHLQDAALLLAVIEDPYLERNRFSGSDRSRLRTLARVLPDDARSWRLLPSEWRVSGQAALRILTA